MKFSRLFFSITIYNKYLEVKEGFLLFAKRTSIPLSNIASVDLSRFTKQIVILTNDGKEYKYSFGSKKKNQACMEAILNKL